jgi:phosphoribosyl 1,2-cyclic phosphodiesterase
MSLELCILASGSMGNCSIVRTPEGVLMIDAGIGPRTCAKRLDGTGVRLGDLRAICLTHLDSDHFRATWVAVIVAHEIPVFCHRSRRRALSEIVARRYADPDLLRRFRSLVQAFDGRAFTPFSRLEVAAIPLAHDDAGSHAFVLEGFGSRMGYASDLGRVPRSLLNQFVDLDILALESNYDPAMELRSSRPAFLKNRIMGGRGHLSNQQAFDAVRAIFDRPGARRPQHVALLHRSRECNCPKLLRKLFERDRRIASRLILAEQFQRSGWLRSATTRPQAGEQLTLSWG